MELKPLDNIIQKIFCYVSRSFGLQKYNKTHSHEINSLYTECWKPFFKQKMHLLWNKCKSG